MTVDNQAVSSVTWEITEINDPIRVLTPDSAPLVAYIEFTGTTAVKKTYSKDLSNSTCAAYVQESIPVSGASYTLYDSDDNVAGGGTIDRYHVQIGGRPADDPNDVLARLIVAAVEEGAFGDSVWDVINGENNHIICLDLPPTIFSNGFHSATLKMTRVFA